MSRLVRHAAATTAVLMPGLLALPSSQAADVADIGTKVVLLAPPLHGQAWMVLLAHRPHGSSRGWAMPFGPAMARLDDLVGG